MPKEPTTKELWEQYRVWMKTCLRTIKPWKKTEAMIIYDGDKENSDYILGWNECLKEMRKNEVKWFKDMDIIFEEDNHSTKT